VWEACSKWARWEKKLGAVAGGGRESSALPGWAAKAERAAKGCSGCKNAFSS